MEEFVYTITLCGMTQGSVEWFNSIYEENIATNYNDILNGAVYKASEEQIEFFKLHPDYDIYHLFYMLELTDDEKHEKYLKEITKVKAARKRLYETQSDGLYIEYQKDLALGNLEEAERVKQEWLAKVREIEENNPYPIE